MTTINRLSIVNDALAETGNNLVATEGESTDEWAVASRGYNNALPILLEAHPWTFAKTTETLIADPDNPSDRYSNAYEMPTSSLFLVEVTLKGLPVEYVIIGTSICCNVDSAELLATFVEMPATSAITNSFFGALRKKVEASCLRGLNEDYSEARNRDREADMLLAEEKSRVDRQQPRHVARRSRMLARRRGRNPDIDPRDPWCG